MTKDTTPTPAGRQEYQNGPESGRLYLAPSAAGDPTLWMRREDGYLIAVVSDYQICPSVRAEAWAALTANALPPPEDGDL